MDDRLTVVIATRDRRVELLRTLERLTALPEAPAIIVVDNDSSDGTDAAVPAGFPRVRVIRLARNHGAAARTVGARAARTPYVAFSDDDSWWEPGALRRAVEVLEAHPRLGLIAARTLVGPERAEDPINAAMAAGPLPVEGDLPGPRVLGFLACASVVRREAFLEAGGFDRLLFFIGEERMLALELAGRGWDLCYVPDVVAVHEPSSSRPSTGWRRRAELRNSLLTVWMRRPAGVALGETARLAGAAVGDSDARAALAGALRRLPAALARRRPVPRHVEHAVRLVEGAG
ncbi:glycosyltransferase family 2 protein [Thermomonospora umbrina]|uniref:GT2 family glycosyltransferase n=1 Tax=Thermomonospora umbrina TaxID=111806 RepID=A0A3D9T2K6_9ACTN|nr:glycosyltransferase [Thermomonospora umbrina]REF01081.1 GT2 family glycosyltransferase [Thermomonospora umbrina]